MDAVDSADAVVYVLGDLEGQLHLTYTWFVDMKLIRYDAAHRDVVWLGGPNVWVVQTGDQVDALRVDVNPADPVDVLVYLFMQHLWTISGGHVVNIMGNHELMCVRGDTRYLHPTDERKIRQGERKKLWSFNGYLGRYLRSRSVIFRINDALFSHAGLDPDIYEFAQSVNDDVTVDQVIRMSNREMGVKSNYLDAPRMWTRHFKNMTCPLMWNRWYARTPDERGGREMIIPPSILEGETPIHLMIIGHNGGCSNLATPLCKDQMYMITQDEVNVSTIQYITGSQDIVIPQTPNFQIMLMTDAVDRKKNSTVYKLIYVLMRTPKGQSRFDKVHVITHKIQHLIKCPLYDEHAMISEMRASITTTT